MEYKTVETFKIFDDVPTFDDALKIISEYGEPDTNLDLPEVSLDETTSVPDQEWHQDGSHVKYFPIYSALWCERASENSPITQIVSTRITSDLAEKYKDQMVGLNFKKTIDENKFFKFQNKVHARLYSMKAHKAKTPLVDKDNEGYYVRWCPFTIMDDPKDHEFFQKHILEERTWHEITWKPNRLLIMQNHATIHRRKPFVNLENDRLLKRCYVRQT